MSSEDKSQENQQEDFVAPSDVDAESILEGVLEGADSEATSESADNAQEGQQHSSEESGAGEDWKTKALALEAELGSLKDAAIRAQAEAQNVRRRAEQDVEKAHKFALEKFSKELLPVLDGLEKAIEAEQAAQNDMTPLREGVEMTLSMMLGGIAKFGVEQVDPVGKPFDPSMHEAMSMVEAPDAESNSVIAAMQKGYTLNGRLIRPAMVVVAK